jgi:hypothetical protein
LIRVGRGLKIVVSAVRFCPSAPFLFRNSHDPQKRAVLSSALWRALWAPARNRRALLLSRSHPISVVHWSLADETATHVPDCERHVVNVVESGLFHPFLGLTDSVVPSVRGGNALDEIH